MLLRQTQSESYFLDDTRDTSPRCRSFLPRRPGAAIVPPGLPIFLYQCVRAVRSKNIARARRPAAAIYGRPAERGGNYSTRLRNRTRNAFSWTRDG